MIRAGSCLVLFALFFGCEDDVQDPADVSTADVATDVGEDAPVEDAPVDAVDVVPANEIRGRVRYEDLEFEANGFTGESTWRPARAVEVSLRVGGRERVVTQTDDEGRFVLVHEEPINTDAVVRVTARVREGAQVVQTQTHSEEVYFLEAAALTGDATPVNIDAAASELGGAFNITDVTLDALRIIAPHIGEAAPRLGFGWEKGEPWPCGSCYGDDVVKLGGQVEDTDEYDDDIILHEYGHYFVEYYSRDSSPGGSHRDRQVSPVLAYGEGIAYFFTLMVTGRDIIVDNYIDGTRTIDFNRYIQNGGDRPGFVGTEDGTLEGNLREEIIGGIMLDAMDPADASEPFDTVALGTSGMLALFIDHFGQTRTPSQGAPGVDLSDFLWALQCVAEVPREAVQALADDRRFPWRAPARCE
ncbi:MAG: hypothetical protein AB8H86_06815 [Polyangiales bacterium]